MRTDKRKDLDFRVVKFNNGYIKNSPGSCLIEQGDTRVLTTITYQNRVPFFMKDTPRPGGWITAEYSMLPGASGNERIQRERQRLNKRNVEIQRFISRALRTVFDLRSFGERTILVDCDVIQADGSTRCASFNSAMVSMVQFLRYLVFEHLIKDMPALNFASAVSLGVKNERILVDLDYREDSGIDSDLNIISNERGEIIEIQALVEKKPLPRDLFVRTLDIALEKNKEIIEVMKKSLEL
jgi:ribonuclease PH